MRSNDSAGWKLGEIVAASLQAQRLARTLRDLRESHWPEASLTQAQLAKALSKDTRVAGATLSSWESATNPKLPPESRMRSYALFFCSERSMEGEPHLLAERDLTEAEKVTFSELETELLELYKSVREPTGRRPPVPGIETYTWEFHDGPVTIVCPEAPAETRGPLAAESDPNFTKMYQYADLDALIELYGHLRANNPELGIFFRLPSEVSADDLSGHLVLLGGSGWNNVARRLLATLRQMPIAQVTVDDLETGEIFRTSEPDERLYYPEWEEIDGSRELAEDVALLARVRNPYNSNRTLTICNGIHSRGVLGAVRCLTDARVRDINETYLAERFPEGDFAVLMRVPVLQGEAISPDLGNPETRLYEWSTIK
jgi:hypothetical protein